MSRNRRRHQNKVPIASLSPLVLLAGLLLVGGITWVYMKHQLVQNGRRITALEKELKAEQTKNKDAKDIVAGLSSVVMLKKRLADGFIHLEPLEPSRVVAVQYRAGAGSVATLTEEEIVPVANRTTR